jgi:DNA helicase II / ATP-dependent DNA helicase PcrA
VQRQQSPVSRIKAGEFPEEGKYLLDGHRKCGVKFSPRETLAQGGRCPVCGAAMTVGVLSRVEALADRSVAAAAPPATAGVVSNLVALPEMLGEIAGSGPSSKTVECGYGWLLSALGPELDILQAVPLEDISRADSSVLAEAVARLRAGKVIRDACYDGEYGVIRLFEPDELRRRTAGGMLFELPPAVPVPVVREGAQAKYHRRSLRRTSRPPPPPPTPRHKREGRRGPHKGEATRPERKPPVSSHRSTPISARRRPWSRVRC